MTDSAIHPDPSTPIATTTQAYRDAAHRIWHDDGRIEIDDDAQISRGDSNGAYVQAWVWVNDDELEPNPGPAYDTWIAEPDDWEWIHAQRFTCEDDPDGKGARRSAHEYARWLRKTYPCAYVAVCPAEKAPLPVYTQPEEEEPPFKDFSASWLGL